MAFAVPPKYIIEPVKPMQSTKKELRKNHSILYSSFSYIPLQSMFPSDYLVIIIASNSLASMTSSKIHK